MNIEKPKSLTKSNPMKNRLPILVLTTLTFCLSNATAQLNTFDLSRYKTADYSRKQLTFSGTVNGSYSENKQDNGYEDYDKSLLSNLNLDYLSSKNTRKTQRTMGIFFSLKPNDYSLSSESLSTSTFYNYNNTRANRNNASLYFYSSNRQYFKNNMFVEINPNGSIDGNFSKQETKTTINSNTSTTNKGQRSLSTNFSLPLLFGAGRLENVEDARMAIFILEDLQKNNQLSRSISEEDILKFSEKITQLRNKRHFDSRKRRIYEIQSLDSFIRDNGYSGAQDAVYFSGLIDNWGYANNPVRFSGRKFSIGAGPTLNYSINHNLSLDKTNNFRRGLMIALTGNLEKPVSLKWQRSINLNAGYQKLKNENTFKFNNYEDIKNSLTNDMIYLSADLGYGYYPDSRSYHQISLNPVAQKTWIEHESANYTDNSEMYYNILLRLNGYIFISERFYVNYSFDIRYGESNTEYSPNPIKKNNFDTSFNLSCSYSIF